MSKINDGGPAFPQSDCALPPCVPYSGMSLRAWLAGIDTLSEWDNPEAVMPTSVAEALAGEKTPEGNYSTDPIGHMKFEAKWRAALKLIRADALIAELEKWKP